MEWPLIKQTKTTKHMKNFKFTLHTVAACAIAALAVACSSDDESGVKPTGVKETITLTAYQSNGEANTRLGFDNKGKAYWHSADKIGVWSNGESKFNAFDLSDGAGTATASFRGEVVDGAGDYAVYPYNENHKLSGTTLTYNLPSSYTYTSVDQTFFPEGNDGSSFGMPMWGTVTDDNTVSFKHLGGVVCIMIDKMPAASGTVKVTSRTKLCGSFSASLTNDTPEIKTSYAYSTSDQAVTFVYSGATVDTAGVFYLPVATGSYHLSIEVSGNKMSSSFTTDVEMKRTRLQVVNVTTNYTTSHESSDGSKMIHYRNFINLGLPSGLLWAEENIGATTAADDGNYYAWGETEPQTSNSYSWDSYKYGSSSSDLTKYTSTDNKTVLENSDDAAYVNWGSLCRMPTQAEFAELCDTTNCKWTWTSRTNSSNDTINGYEVTSKKNGNSIFLPASGNRYESNLDYHGSYGYYWSSTLHSNYTNSACCISFRSDNFGIYRGYRRYGRPVRPVAEP
jgi:hypothetical protein